MKNGKIGVTTENIFPVIKKFLYSDHEIFLRELISNAVDATQKLEAPALVDRRNEGRPGRPDDPRCGGHGCKTAAHDHRPRNRHDGRRGRQATSTRSPSRAPRSSWTSTRIRRSSGISDWVSTLRSWSRTRWRSSPDPTRRAAKTVHWECNGTPEFAMEETDEAHDRGTTIVLHLSEEAQGVRRSDSKVEELLRKYCRFLPVPDRLRQGQGVEGRQVRRYRQGQRHQRHRSAVDAQAGRHHRGAVQGVLPRALPDERRAAVLDPPEHRLSVPPDGHPLLPEDPQQLRDSEEQDPALLATRST